MTARTKFKCPKCGNFLVKMDGLTGLFCSDKECGYFEEREVIPSDLLVTPSDIFSEERVKSLRGVPCNKIVLGSETKGRIEIQIPCNASDVDRRTLIEQAVADLKYTKQCIENSGMDIYSARGKKNE